MLEHRMMKSRAAVKRRPAAMRVMETSVWGLVFSMVRFLRFLASGRW
jgi:hypothetical protein